MTSQLTLIENYLNKYGDLFRNRKQALSLGIVDANSLKPAELNKRLAQKLYDMGWCVAESGKLLEENKCPKQLPPSKTPEKPNIFQKIGQFFGLTSPKDKAAPAADGKSFRYSSHRYYDSQLSQSPRYYPESPRYYQQSPRYYQQSPRYYQQSRGYYPQSRGYYQQTPPLSQYDE